MTMPPLLDDHGRDTVLCRLDDIAEPAARAFRIKGRKEIFVARFDGGVFAYRNSCPHTGVTLEWADDQFFNYDRTLLQCSVHGALFRVADGHCVWGPCAGGALTPVKIRIEDGAILLDE